MNLNQIYIIVGFFLFLLYLVYNMKKFDKDLEKRDREFKNAMLSIAKQTPHLYHKKEKIIDVNDLREVCDNPEDL